MEAVLTGLFQTKLLPNGALNNMQLPGWVLTTVAGPTEAHYQEDPFKKKLLPKPGEQHPTTRSGPLPKQSRLALPKRNCC